MAEKLTVGVIPTLSSIGSRGVDPGVFERLFGAPARTAGVELEPLGVTLVPDQPVSFERLSGVWWVSAEASADPCQICGQHVVPEVVLDRLQLLWAGGLRLDYLRVLHEVPDPAWSPGQPLPSLIPAAPSHRAVDTALLAGIHGTLTGARKVARASGHFAAGVAKVAAVVAVAPVVLLGDPVLLGGRRIGEDRVLWVELARWEWS